MAVPLLVAFVLFQIADLNGFDSEHIGAITLIISGIILFIMDNYREKVIEGDIIQKTISLPRKRNQNTLMQIEMRYWGVFMLVVGMVWVIG